MSDVNACTRDVLRFRLRSGRHSLVIVDLPGVGENGRRDHGVPSPVPSNAAGAGPGAVGH